MIEQTRIKMDRETLVNLIKTISYLLSENAINAIIEHHRLDSRTIDLDLNDLYNYTDYSWNMDALYDDYDNLISYQDFDDGTGNIYIDKLRSAIIENLKNKTTVIEFDTKSGKGYLVKDF